MKKTKKLGFQLAIPLNFEMFATQPDLIAWDIASRLEPLIVSLFLKFLGIVEILLVNNHEVSKLGR